MTTKLRPIVIFWDREADGLPLQPITLVGIKNKFFADRILTDSVPEIAPN
jgi:hypothetical protein